MPQKQCNCQPGLVSKQNRDVSYLKSMVHHDFSLGQLYRHSGAARPELCLGDFFVLFFSL
jgi:hypothetical protein